MYGPWFLRIGVTDAQTDRHGDEWSLIVVVVCDASKNDPSHDDLTAFFLSLSFCFISRFKIVFLVFTMSFDVYRCPVSSRHIERCFLVFTMSFDVYRCPVSSRHIERCFLVFTISFYVYRCPVSSGHLGR